LDSTLNLNAEYDDPEKDTPLFISFWLVHIIITFRVGLRPGGALG